MRLHCCVAPSYNAGFALDMTDRPVVMYMRNSPGALRICVNACPTTVNSTAELCLSGIAPTLMAHLSPDLVAWNQLDPQGCPTHVTPSVVVLNRCTPTSQPTPTEGPWVDIAAVLMVRYSPNAHFRTPQRVGLHVLMPARQSWVAESNRQMLASHPV